MSTAAAPLTSDQQYQQYLAQLQAQGGAGNDAFNTGAPVQNVSSGGTYSPYMDSSDSTTGSSPGSFNTPNASNPYASGVSSDAGPYGNPYATTTPGLVTSDTVNNSNFYNDQSIEYAQENQLEGEAQAQLGYYGPLQEQEQQNAQDALNSFQTTPGYTPSQANQINVDYSQYNTPTSALQQQFLTPQEQAEIAGNPNAPAQTMSQGVNAEGQMLNQYQVNLGGEVGNYDTDVGGEVGNLDTGTTSAVGTLGSDLSSAQSQFSGLNAAVSNPALAFNPGGNEQEITPAEMQEMETAAGTTVGNQYQSAEDQLKQSAANAGNSSPLAIAAANARLNVQSASEAGDAETQAQIAALQAQEQQATSMEQQRESAAQYQSGLGAQASTTEEAAAQNAAALAGTQGVSAAELEGTQGISAAEAEGNVGVNAANEYGQYSTSTAGNMANQEYGAQETAEQEAAQRAAALATNRQATETGVNQTQYNQGTGSAQMTAGGAENVGQQDIAGRNTYLSGVTQQQSLAQQGGETAEGSQQTAASTLGSQLNTSEANAGAFKNNSPTLAGQSSDVITAASKLLDTGGIITEPTLAVIGEKRPEMVIPVGPRYRPREREAA